ncbi:MAG: hypothetical protein NC092_00190 [Butyrivibrio sp.]|nr:hypothetical protein [Muribaculum sp.]MCM1551093.1 hypothetical protein [Butyrivibrio sp.]
MEATVKRYTLADLSGLVGKVVRKSELSEIYDICMILQKTKRLSGNDVEGVLTYFGEGGTPEYDSLFTSGNAVTPIYNDSEELAEGVVYDE